MTANITKMTNFSRLQETYPLVFECPAPRCVCIWEEIAVKAWFTFITHVTAVSHSYEVNTQLVQGMAQQLTMIVDGTRWTGRQEDSPCEGSYCCESLGSATLAHMKLKKGSRAWEVGYMLVIQSATLFCYIPLGCHVLTVGKLPVQLYQSVLTFGVGPWVAEGKVCGAASSFCEAVGEGEHKVSIHSLHIDRNEHRGQLYDHMTCGQDQTSSRQGQ